MSKSNVQVKRKMSIGEIILRFFFGFLIPFVIINGLAFFFCIQVPNITVVDKESSEYEDSKIKFSVNCILPIISIKTSYEDKEIPYIKYGDMYIVDANDNGSYQIAATALNRATSQVIATIETKDVVSPIIDIDNAVITSNMLIFSIFDAESEINFDNIYAITESGDRIAPSYIDRSSNTIQFQIEAGKKLTVHVEDIEGNPTETTFIAND